jgi:CheY-like chemotaxis protein
LENSFSDLCHEKNLMLSFHCPDIHTTGDPSLLTQVLRNLLANAIQYTDKGSIDVTFENNNGFLRFSVMDTGHGIPEEDLPVIFKEFFRSEHSRSHHDGLGLGLSIVNRIVQKIGGTCSVKSTLGKGSIFTIDTQFPASTVGTSSANSKLNLPQTRINDAPRAQDRNEVASKGDWNIGIIENDLSLQQAYEQYFSNLGYSVYIIPHEESEFTQYLAAIPKLHFILSDYRLGKHDGVFFIQKLREEFNEEIPACIVTADTSPQHVQLFEELNINVLYKPIDIQSIEAFISKSLQLDARVTGAQ